jgi:hypothetical protein
MEVGKKYKHKGIETMTCEVVAITNKGCKAMVSDTAWKRGKPITQYFEGLFFHKEKGVWEAIN